MQKRLLVIDIDGTIAQPPKKLRPIKIMNKKDCGDCLHLHADGCHRLMWCHKADESLIKQFYNEDSVLDFKPYPQTKVLIKKLFRDGDTAIVYVTARSHNLHDSTQTWLKKHKFPAHESLYCVGKKGEDPLKSKIRCVKSLIAMLSPKQILALEDDEIIAKEYKRKFGAVNLYKNLAVQ